MGLIISPHTIRYKDFYGKIHLFDISRSAQFRNKFTMPPLNTIWYQQLNDLIKNISTQPYHIDDYNSASEDVDLREDVIITSVHTRIILRDFTGDRWDFIVPQSEWNTYDDVLLTEKINGKRAMEMDS